MCSMAPTSGPFPPGTIFFHSIVKPESNGESKLCRKVVVDVRGDTLICLPVTTNGGDATTKLDRARQSKHAIIYTGNRPPNPGRSERHLRKAAIQATTVLSRNRLNPLSRVDYSTEIVVEHTDKLGYLGRVKSVGILLSEWKKVRGDAGSSAPKAAAPEAENAGGGRASQSLPSSALTGPEADTDAQERAPPPQRAVALPNSPPPCVRAERSVADLKPNEVMVKDRRLVRLSENQKSKRLQPDTSSNEVSKLPRAVRSRKNAERKSVSTAPARQTRRRSQGLILKAQNDNLSPDSTVTADNLNEKVEAAVLRVMASRESNKQRAVSVEEIIKQTSIHSQVNGPYNVFQVRPMFNGPPPPYDVMDFEETSRPPVSQRRTEELEPSAGPGRTADRSSSDAAAPNAPPPAPMPPSSGIETPDQDDYEEFDASEDESEHGEQPINPQMSDWKAQRALDTYLKPHRIGTGRGSSSSQAESSRGERQQKSKGTLFHFFSWDRQRVGFEGRLDTGADANFISPRAASLVAHSYHKYRGEPFQVANGVMQMPQWLIFTYWSIENDDDTFWHNSFVVFNQLPCDVVIGVDTIKKNDILRAGPKYPGCFMIQYKSSGGKKEKEKREEERRRRQQHNRQIAAQQNSQTYQELEQQYANEMNAQQGNGGQSGQ